MKGVCGNFAELTSFTNLGNPEKHLVTEDPTFDTYLPVDDEAWDDCVSTDLPLLINSVVQ
jgi:hypothetical protein